jgi:outer membrane protein OmpA-like peptidoglycan-associated protein
MKKVLGSFLIVAVTLGCASDPNKNTKRGAAIGAATGAVAGAVIGNQSGNNRTGAVVGAATGAAVGGLIGRRMDEQQKELQQIEGVEVTRTAEDELNVVLKNDVLFDFGSAALRPESRATLRDMSEVFEKYTDTTISVEGHADSVGTDSDNQVLSERRAGSVKSFLVDEGVPSSRIRAVGYGEERPKESNTTAEGRQLNRRVEIHVKAVPQS